jgi:hypothetical protein
LPTRHGQTSLDSSNQAWRNDLQVFVSLGQQAVEAMLPGNLLTALGTPLDMGFERRPG